VLKKAYQNKYLLIIITNQSGIGKSLYSHQDVNAVHDKLNDELNKNGIKLTEIYYCPHHPSTSNCFCRKPDSLLIEKAIARFKINPKISIFVGDKERDCVAANKAGIGTIYHLQTNSSLKQIINALI
jgi:histidinol-phosphate phosphatase family protein